MRAERLDHREVHERRHVLPLVLADHCRASARTYWSKSCSSTAVSLSHLGSVRLRRPTSAYGRQPTSVSLRKSTPARETVAGERVAQEVRDLEEQAHRGGERDALVGDEREHLVVVHHRVHRLDPLGVDVAVEYDPLGHVWPSPVRRAKSRMILAMMPSYGSLVTGWT